MSRTFAELATEIRNRHGWTHEDVAQRLGVSIHTYQSWLKPEAASAREAPRWALCAAQAMLTGKVVWDVQGEIDISYSHRA